MTPSWTRLFPDSDYRMPMGLRAGDAAVFWGEWDEQGGVVAERKRWLAESPELFRACTPEGVAARTEALEWIAQWTQACEADWVALSGDVAREPMVVAGEVVFPTVWSLPEKLGRPLSEVHGPVPGLESSIGAGIATFLARIECNSAWERENWGLCGNDELNHHPSRKLPRLSAESTPATTWIRLENQFLTRLPETRCILFGIRVNHYRLDSVAALPGMAVRIARALGTMPDAMLRYKGLADCRGNLLAALAV